MGTGKDLTIKKLAEMIMSIVGYEGEIVFDLDKPDGTPQKLLDISRMDELGWQARISLRQGIESTYEWYKRQVKG
jgi:GDP-L-fucose synthase